MCDIIFKGKIKPVMSHFNYVHCGVEILSMSKQIMNKVFSCATGCDVKVYYQHTNNIYLNYVVDKIVEKYKGKYDKS